MTYQMTNERIIQKIKEATVWTVTMTSIGLFGLLLFMFTFTTMAIIGTFLAFVLAILFEISREALIIRMEIRCKNE